MCRNDLCMKICEYEFPLLVLLVCVSQVGEPLFELVVLVCDESLCGSDILRNASNPRARRLITRRAIRRLQQSHVVHGVTARRSVRRVRRANTRRWHVAVRRTRREPSRLVPIVAFHGARRPVGQIRAARPDAAILRRRGGITQHFDGADRAAACRRDEHDTSVIRRGDPRENGVFKA